MSKEKNLAIKNLIKLIDQYLQLPPKLKRQAKGLHKMRQAAREILSLLPEEDYPQQRIKRVIQASNKIRDLDVLILELLPRLPEEFTATADLIKEQLLDVRWNLDDDFKNDLQLEMVPEIESCKDEYAHAMHQAQPKSIEHHQEKLKELKKQFKKVQKHLSLVDLENKQIHKLRLKIKRMRYQVAHLFADQHELLAKLKYLQQQLGEFHDYDQAQKMMAKYTDIDAQIMEPVFKYLRAEQQKILSRVRKKITKY